jgi:hypothetical protein
MFLHTICHNIEMFRSILIIFKEVPNVIKMYIKY